jgi:hypothetical protein
MGEKKQLHSPAQIKQDNRTSQEDTYSNKNKPTHNSTVEITMPGTDHHCKPQPEIPVSKEGDNAKTRRNKRRQEKADQNQTAQLSTTENSPTNSLSWRYSLYRTFASLKTFALLFFSFAFLRQPLMPIFLKSCSTSSTTDRTSQEGTYSTQNKSAHNSPVEITMPGTDHHSKPQPEIPVSKERDNAKTRRKRGRRQESVSYSEVIPH